MVVYFCWDSAWSSAVHEAQSDAALQVRQSGMGASSASAMAHSTGVFGSGYGSMCLEKNSSWAWKVPRPLRRPRRTRRCSCPQAMPSKCPRGPWLRDLHSSEDWRHHALFMARPSKEPSRKQEWRSPASGCSSWSCGRRPHRRTASVTCFTAGGIWARCEGKRPAWRPEGGLASVDAGHVPEEDPRVLLGRVHTVSRVAASCRSWSSPACPAGHGPCWRRLWVSWPPSCCFASELVWPRRPHPISCTTSRGRHEVLSIFTTRSALTACCPWTNRAWWTVGACWRAAAQGCGEVRCMPCKSCFTQVKWKGSKILFEKKETTTQTVTSLQFLETNLSHDGPHRSRSKVISASEWLEAALRCKKTRLAQLRRRGSMQNRRAAAVVEMDLGKKKIEENKQAEIVPQWTNERRQQGCLRNNFESSPFNSNRPQPPTPINLLWCTHTDENCRFATIEAYWESNPLKISVTISFEQPPGPGGSAERAARRIGESISTMLLQSGLDENWWADTMECNTYLRNIQDLLSDGKTPHQRRCGKKFEGRLFHFTGWVLPYLYERPVKNPSIWKESQKSYLDCSSDTLCTREGWGRRGTFWLQTLKSWERWTHLKSIRKDSMQKVITDNGKFIFPIEDGRIKPLGEDQELRKIHLDRASPNSRRKSKGIFFSWRIRRVSSTTSRLTSGCRWSNKRLLVHVGKLHTPPSRWTQSQTQVPERRIIPCSTEIHGRLQNHSHEFGCQAGDREHRWLSRLVWSLDRFHTIYSIRWKKFLTDVGRPLRD